MEHLTPEGKAIYDTVNAAHEKLKADLHNLIVAAVNKSVPTAVDLAVDKAVGASMSAAVRDMQAYTDGVEADLRAAMGLASHGSDPSSSKALGGVAEIGQGHHDTSTTRGLGVGTHVPYIPPPARGIQDNSTLAVVNQSTGVTSSFGSLLNRERRTFSGHGKPPSMDFPKFSGDNPKFWQARSEDYFAMFDTDPDLWIAVAAMQFEGEAAQWLASVQHKIGKASWQDFVAAVLHRFGKNQHQSFVNCIALDK